MVSTKRDERQEISREWLDVPFSEKDEAKLAGARWDPVARRWYAPQPGMKQLEKWKEKPPVPSVLPGEDRSFGSGLYADPIPSSCWYTNVRSSVSQVDWKRIRRMVIERAAGRCEICGSDKSLEAHERFQFDDAAHIQSLRRLICLCKACHRTTHYGLARVHGSDKEAFRHLMAVNSWTASEALLHLDQVFKVWRRRSCFEWQLDLSMLEGTGISLNATSTPKKRKTLGDSKKKSGLGSSGISQLRYPKFRRGPEINF